MEEVKAAALHYRRNGASIFNDSKEVPLLNSIAAQVKEE